MLVAETESTVPVTAARSPMTAATLPSLGTAVTVSPAWSPTVDASGNVYAPAAPEDAPVRTPLKKVPLGPSASAPTPTARSLAHVPPEDAVTAKLAVPPASDTRQLAGADGSTRTI